MKFHLQIIVMAALSLQLTDSQSSAYQLTCTTPSTKCLLCSASMTL